jgi:hypothetical protein
LVNYPVVERSKPLENEGRLLVEGVVGVQAFEQAYVEEQGGHAKLLRGCHEVPEVVQRDELLVEAVGAQAEAR